MSDLIAVPWDGELEVFSIGWYPKRAGSDPVNYQGHTYALHMHQYHAVFWLGGRRVELAPGDITLTPPHVGSSYEWVEQAGEHWCIHFTVTGSRRLMLPAHHRPTAYSAPMTQRLAWLTDLGRLRQSEQEFLAVQGVKAGLSELLLWLHFQEEFSRSSPGSRVSAALDNLVELLERQYARDWSAKELADHAGMNANYLARMFRERYGCTIHQFLLRHRVDAAQGLLRSTTLRIKEIAATVGIADMQKFNKDFRRIAGCSPTAFRLKFRRWE